MKKYNNNPANIYLLKVNNRNTRKRCEICSKLTIKTTEGRLGIVLVIIMIIVIDLFQFGL